MKIKNLFLIASVAALLAGCNRGNSLADEPDGPQPLPTDAAGTMNVSLKYAVQTRASYQQGSDSESSAKTLTIYFFDDDAEHTYLGVGESSSLTSKPGDSNNGIDKKITAVEVPANVVGSLYGKDSKTMYVVAVLNKGKFAPNLTPGTSKYKDFNEAIIGDITVSDAAAENNFLMTSSNYLDSNNAEMALTPITKANIGIKSSSVNEDPQSDVVIAVERVVAKVVVKTKNDADLKIAGWGLNVANKAFYPVKNLGGSDFVEILEGTYGGWKPYADGFWNTSSAKRSHWAVDPNYTTGTVENDNNLVAFSFTDSPSTPKDVAQYCFENTMIENLQYRNSTTSVVIVAQYYPEGIISGTWIEWKGLGYTPDDLVKQVLSEADLSDYKKADGSELGAGDFEFVYEGATEANAIKFGEKKIVIGYQKAEATVVLKGGITLADGKTADDVNGVMEAVLGQAAATVYHEGYCYYVVPIRHFLDEEIEAAFDPINSVYAPETLGRYGVVRNNYYTITVNDITTPGAAVTDPTVDPSTDPDDDTKYSINVNIEVLSWTVRNQSVDL